MVERYKANSRQRRWRRHRGDAVHQLFQELSQLAGSAPRMVWIRRGNCAPPDIETLLRKHSLRIAGLESDPDTKFLVLL